MTPFEEPTRDPDVWGPPPPKENEAWPQPHMSEHKYVKNASKKCLESISSSLPFLPLNLVNGFDLLLVLSTCFLFKLLVSPGLLSIGFFHEYVSCRGIKYGWVILKENNEASAVEHQSSEYPVWPMKRTLILENYGVCSTWLLIAGLLDQLLAPKYYLSFSNFQDNYVDVLVHALGCYDNCRQWEGKYSISF